MSSFYKLTQHYSLPLFLLSQKLIAEVLDLITMKPYLV